MKIEDELEKSLNNGCANLGGLVKRAISELRILRAGTENWDGHAWKEGMALSDGSMNQLIDRRCNTLY